MFVWCYARGRLPRPLPALRPTALHTVPWIIEGLVAIIEAEEASEVDARELLAAAATRPPKALPPLPDLMEAVGPEERLGKKPNAQQASRGLRHSAAYRALAFSDAWRATRLAPAWGE